MKLITKRKKMANGGEVRDMMNALTRYGSFFAAVLLLVGGILFFDEIKGNLATLAQEHVEVKNVHNSQLEVLRALMEDIKTSRIEGAHAHERIMEHQKEISTMLKETSRSLDRSNIMMTQIERRLAR